MTGRVEDDLTRIFNDRAATIEQPPAYQLVPPHAGRRRPATPRRIGWHLVASAAAVAALVAVVTSVVSNRDDHRRPKPADQWCQLSQSSRFSGALRTGLLPAGTTVLSTGPDGTSLAAVERAGVAAKVELIDANGPLATVWTARAGERVRVVANPFAAVASSYAAFVLVPLDAGPTRLMIVDRDTNVAEPTPLPAAGFRLGTDPATAPLAGGFAPIEVLTTSVTHPTEQRLDAHWPNMNPIWAKEADASGVTRLLKVGGNVVFLRSGAGGSVDIRFAEPKYRPTTLPAAVRTGFAFSSDGTTMTWLTDDGGRPLLWHWAVGDPQPIHRPLPGDLTPVSATGRYVVGEPAHPGAGRTLVDTRTGAIAQLPAGLDLITVAGKVALLSQQTGDTVRYARVPTSVMAC